MVEAKVKFGLYLVVLTQLKLTSDGICMCNPSQNLVLKSFLTVGYRALLLVILLLQATSRLPVQQSMQHVPTVA